MHDHRNPLRGTDWGRLLENEFGLPYWATLEAFLEQERSRAHVYPPEDQVFRALELTPCARTKVVILGQDPYHGSGQAHGLCFSVPPGIEPPPSLVNIHKELHADGYLARPDDGNLKTWADQGVLLLNTTLTVRRGEPGSHRGKGWGRFTDAVIRVVTAKSDPIFLLWGGDAQRKERLITRITGSADKIFKSSHPSPMSARRPCLGSPPFSGSRPFSKVNALLPRPRRIDWSVGS